MRPQHITAENAGPESADQRGRCFNEAAAYHCGKLRSGMSEVISEMELQ